jgi:hypothetical protein
LSEISIKMKQSLRNLNIFYGVEEYVFELILILWDQKRMNDGPYCYLGA